MAETVFFAFFSRNTHFHETSKRTKIVALVIAFWMYISKHFLDSIQVTNFLAFTNVVVGESR